MSSLDANGQPNIKSYSLNFDPLSPGTVCSVLLCYTVNPSHGHGAAVGRLDGFFRKCYEDVGELTMHIPICELQCL